MLEQTLTDSLPLGNPAVLRAHHSNDPAEEKWVNTQGKFQTENSWVKARQTPPHHHRTCHGYGHGGIENGLTSTARLHATAISSRTGGE